MKTGTNIMARPKPKILTEIADKESYKIDQVLHSEAIWAVAYQGSLINLKTSNMTKNGVIHKYKKVSFSNSGHAINLAKKLNKQYKTDEFTVVKLESGETIYDKNNDQ